MGVLISYLGRKTQFWYPCQRSEIREVLANHVQNWKQETVLVDGQEVTRIIPITELTAVYVTKWGSDQPVESEPIPVADLLR